MWPYRPWLFKAQHRPQAQSDGSGSSDSSGTTSAVPSSTQLATQSQSPSHFQSQLRPRPQASPQFQSPTHDWTRRYQPTTNSRVYGYPSPGGVLILPGYDIDLPYLGLERYTEARRAANPIAEDQFCRRLRWLGAIWWPYPDADLDALKGQSGVSQADVERAAIHVVVGWLSNGGGVWVLKYSENDQDDNDLSLKAQRVGSLNMNDRCRMIEELGGTFYKHPDECEDLRWGGWIAPRASMSDHQLQPQHKQEELVLKSD